MRAGGLACVAGLAAALCLVPTVAFAHGTLAAGDFYAGVLQPVTHPESLLVVLALALLAGQQPEPNLPSLLGAILVATLLGSALAATRVALPSLPWVARAGALIAGILVAARWAPHWIALVVFAAIVAASHGYSATFGELEEIERPLLYVPGLVAGVLLILGNVVSLMLRFDAFWTQVAYRIVGSWIATITLLVSALELRGPS
ncbi:MAG: hypothetical protein FJ144_09650 [Deltaproteobacteria bacterium]|nr:hypothetical protein [Deltaproteobacteria bacterium]